MVHQNSRRWGLAGVLLFCAVLFGAGLLTGQSENSENQTTQKGNSKTSTAREQYKGRKIAPVMDAAHADWLTRPERARQEDTATMLQQLRLEKGDVVCDFGCGNGYHTLKMAKRVGENGWVYGVDIQPKMLQLLNDRAAQKDIDNITPVLGTVTDPRVPDGSVDLVLMVDVYHELSHPERILQAVRDMLKPDGRVALVEFRAEDPDVPIRPLHKMSKKQIMKEFPPNGFRLKRSFGELPWQHMMMFQRDRIFGDGKTKLVPRGAKFERVSTQFDGEEKQTDPNGRVYRCADQSVVVESPEGQQVLEIRLEKKPVSVALKAVPDTDQHDLYIQTDAGQAYRLRIQTGTSSEQADQ